MTFSNRLYSLACLPTSFTSVVFPMPPMPYTPIMLKLRLLSASSISFKVEVLDSKCMKPWVELSHVSSGMVRKETPSNLPFSRSPAIAFASLSAFMLSWYRVFKLGHNPFNHRLFEFSLSAISVSTSLMALSTVIIHFSTWC
ncbi:hypothetical protein CICLE_v10004083mg [Citrus x clementina]|uniref:Uncharacterized protein n=1 Tax=Citrus clementina TaxID=85681 RepID=V4V3G0_CITCL|nr:hypothetical protein CICLE_v10004083mg [Citrus x clementina]